MPPAVQQPIPFVLPEALTSPDDDIVTMFGIDPEQVRTLNAASDGHSFSLFS
jgi:hypothetical protein